MIEKLLTEDKIRLYEKAESWEHAIYLSAEPLLKAGNIEESYINKIIENVRKYGPYIVICPYVAIPHAEIESGVNKLGMSLLLLRQEVYMLNDIERPVKLLITLAPESPEGHLTALSELAAILSDENSLHKILEAEHVSEIMEAIQLTP